MKNQRTIAYVIALALVAFSATGCSKNSTPTKTVQMLADAFKNKDVKELKSVMSKEVLAEDEKEAKAQNKSLDDYYRELLDEAAKQYPNLTGTLPTRNETIAADGKTATVEFQTAKDWRTIRLVKEDDGWKIAGL